MGFQDYDIIEELGSGSYGKVFTVRDRRTGEICVQKIVSLDGVDEKDREETLNEARLMSQCEHFNIIKYLDSFIENNYLCIIMEYASGGDLTKKIKAQQGKPFKEDLVWNFLIQISQGLKYLHDKRILHRDLKPQNIFLDAEDNIKIGDMGLGRILGPQSSFASSNVGTPLYQSPELCQEKPYNHKSDIWAFGCLLYELAAFSPPFLATNQIALAKKIVGDRPNSLPKIYSMELQFLIFKMLEKEPSKRPDINQILNYSAVKLRIQKAKLRHKELKLKEQFLTLEKQLRMDYETKIDMLERKLSDYSYQEEQVQMERENIRERAQELDKKENGLRELEEKLLRKQHQLNELIKHGHVIISTPNSGIGPTITPSIPSPFTSPVKEHGTPQRKVDSKYYKPETTKVVQEKFNSLYNMFHEQQPNTSPNAQKARSAPSTPVKKRTDAVPKTPSPKPVHRPKSNGNAPLEHTPKQKRKNSNPPSTPNVNSSQVSVGSSVQLDSKFVGKVMGKIMQKKQTTETPLGNKGRKLGMGGSPDEGLVDNRVKKKLSFEESEPTLFRPMPRTSPISRHFDFRISEPKIEIEEFNSDEENSEEDLFVLRRKLKNEELNK